MKKFTNNAQWYLKISDAIGNDISNIRNFRIKDYQRFAALPLHVLVAVTGEVLVKGTWTLAKFAFIVETDQPAANVTEVSKMPNTAVARSPSMDPRNWDCILVQVVQSEAKARSFKDRVKEVETAKAAQVSTAGKTTATAVVATVPTTSDTKTK